MNCLFTVSLISLSTFVFASETQYKILAPGERLQQGQVVTNNGKCKLLLQSDGNLIVKKDDKNTWSSGTHDTHTSDGPFFLKLNRGGALVIRTDSDEGIFSTNTRNIMLDNEQGGLFFNNQDCTISIKADDEKYDIWTNIRSNFYNGNRLERGDMIKYPPYILHLQNDGNLVMFEGTDLSDYDGPGDILWGAGVTSSSDSDRFFLKFTCDGRLVLKERIGNTVESYWTESVVTQGESVGSNGLSLILQPDDNTFPFGYDSIENAACQNGPYTQN